MNGNTWISTAVWGALDVVEGIYSGGPALQAALCVSATPEALWFFFVSQAPECFYEQSLPLSSACPSPGYFLHCAELAMSLRML